VRILKIDHIGVAVRDLDAHLALFGDKLGLPIRDREEEDPYGGLKSAFARVGDVDFEFLQDLAPAEGAKAIDQRDIAKWIERRGEGLHHIALRVADIEEAIRDARAAGLRVIDETPRPGARGSKIAFLHPRSTGGILIHLVERPGD
jgi:methylmalonyl-CoA/ethylmalonyl-CoA epimerase